VHSSISVPHHGWVSQWGATRVTRAPVVTMPRTSGPISLNKGLAQQLSSDQRLGKRVDARRIGRRAPKEEAPAAGRQVCGEEVERVGTVQRLQPREAREGERPRRAVALPR